MNRNMSQPSEKQSCTTTLPKGSSTACTEPAAEDFTLMSALEDIVSVAEDSALKDENLQKAAKAIDYVCTRTGLERMQAVLLAAYLDLSLEMVTTLSELKDFFNCSTISLLKYQKDIDTLVKKGFLIPGNHEKEGKYYTVPRHVVESLGRNELTFYKSKENLSFEEFFDNMDEYFELRYQGWDYDQFILHVNSLVSANKHLDYCRKIKELKELDTQSLLLVHFFCLRLVNHCESTIMVNQMPFLFYNRKDFTNTVYDFSREKHPLIKQGLVEFANSSGMVDNYAFFLTNMARKTLLAEAGVEMIEATQAICQNELVYCSQIKTKDLFYPENVGQQIERLKSLLQERNFRKICTRLERQGMRKGFACLFHGGPGTGKTETVLQLARSTGRDIMQVDISEMRSKWVGESQKLVKSLFERYRKAVRNSKKAPILLFNEADAVLTKRNSSASGSVDKMENSMQNIFLQELENLEGIMIATTNLTSNLDPAFERRFIYKIEFAFPDAECRAKIWKSMISGLSEEDARLLGSKYYFSGGQIENVKRKQIVDSVLYGEETVSAASLLPFCDTEDMDGRSGKHIGFRL